MIGSISSSGPLALYGLNPQSSGPVSTADLNKIRQSAEELNKKSTLGTNYGLAKNRIAWSHRHIARDPDGGTHKSATPPATPDPETDPTFGLSATPKGGRGLRTPDGSRKSEPIATPATLSSVVALPPAVATSPWHRIASDPPGGPISKSDLRRQVAATYPSASAIPTQSPASTPEAAASDPADAPPAAQANATTPFDIAAFFKNKFTFNPDVSTLLLGAQSATH